MAESTGSVHTLDVRQPYFDYIRDGLKTVEGRAGSVHENYKLKQTKFKKGDTLRFTEAVTTTTSTNAAAADVITCRIVDVSFYGSFEEMLVGSGLANCLPNTDSLEEGVRIYRSFPDYVRKENEYGVIGIHIQVDNWTI